MKPQLVVNPVRSVLLLSGQIIVIVSICIHLSRKSPPDASVWLLGLSLIGYGLSVLQWVLSALRYIPKYWRAKAWDAVGHIEKGGIVLVLGCRVGASAIPFAEVAVVCRRTADIKFVCIDKFSKWWSYPYKPETLLQTLLEVGLPHHSIVAHAINVKEGIAYSKLPFATGSISLIISDNVLSGAWPQEDACFKEMVRVLQPGGRIIVSDPRYFWGSLKKRILSEFRWKHARLERAVGLHWDD